MNTPDSIFVTGGTGFLGRHLIGVLCRMGFQLRVLTRRPEQHPWLETYPRIEIVRGDLLDAAIIRQAVQGCRYVIHGGGIFRFWGDARRFEETNVRGAEHMLEAAAAASIERFVYISTAAVIGSPDPDGVIDEQTPAYPADAYQRSKLDAEGRCLNAYRQSGLPVVVLRPGAFYGPLGQYGFNRLFFRDPMRGIIMQVNGGRYIIFPAYIGDVAQGVALALTRARVGEIYNLSGDWITHRAAFDIICEEARIRWPRLTIPGWMGITAARVLEGIAVVTGAEPFWPLNLHSYVYNNWRVSSEKARRELGFAPIDFREGARRTIAWYRAGQPEDWPEVQCG